MRTPLSHSDITIRWGENPFVRRERRIRKLNFQNDVSTCGREGDVRRNLNRQH